MAMGGDTSLNGPMGEDSDSQWQDLLGDEEPLQNERVAEAEERTVRPDLPNEALETVKESAGHMISERRLTNHPMTRTQRATGRKGVGKQGAFRVVTESLKQNNRD